MNKVLLFAKSPVKGLVKTRLLQKSPLDEEDVLSLYTSFLKDTITAIVQSGAEMIHIAFSPDNAGDRMADVVAESGFQEDVNSGRISFFPQTGEGFDQKITCSVGEVKKPSDTLVIVGSDTPTLTPELINRSFVSLSDLEEGFVLGPSGEGGVYLIGIKFLGELSFAGIFEQGVELDNLVRMASKGAMPLLLLEELTDIDVASDLLSLICYLQAMRYAMRFAERAYTPAYTMDTIEKMNLSVVRDRLETRGKILVKGSA